MKERLIDYLAKKAITGRHNLSEVPAWVIDATIEFINKDVNNPYKIAIEKAWDILSIIDECTVEQQVKNIVEYGDQGEDIDCIEDVQPAEMFELTFTCETFLDQIGWKEEFRDRLPK